MVDMKAIQDLADRIARQFDPEKIILFGSHATGASGPDSDVDLLVVASHGGKGWEMAAAIRTRLRPGFPVVFRGARRSSAGGRLVSTGDRCPRNRAL